MFYHSLLSDWNHGNAHFLRGIVAELQERGHSVRVYEPADGWSLKNLTAEQGGAPLRHFQRLFPHLRSTFYRAGGLDLDRVLHGLESIRSRHTCTRRVDELLAIYRTLRGCRSQARSCRMTSLCGGTDR